MAKNYSTPGVYINELNAFPNAVVAVATGVPVFAGYTETAIQNGQSLHCIPTRISSLNEYHQYFGAAYTHVFALLDGNTKPVNNTTTPAPIIHFSEALLINPAHFFYCYNAIRLFFQNGGGACYIMSLGTYGGDAPTVTAINLNDYSDTVFQILANEAEPSLIVLPDLISVCTEDPLACYTISSKVLQHCEAVQSRFAILDVYCSNDLQQDTELFRNSIGNLSLSYGAAYYPWLHTSIVTANEVSFRNLALSIPELLQLLPDATIADQYSQWQTAKAQNDAIADSKARKAGAETLNKQLQQLLLNSSQVYKQIMNEITNRLNLLPPAGAIAGIYANTDSTRGVWQAPANTSLNAVIKPAVTITDNEQSGMNIPLSGKAINAIRFFTGKGILVWGARTLDGNSNEWRYINVRRTMILIEQSVKTACQPYVFEPNNAATWANVQAMLSSFLTDLWAQGALAGPKPEQAFAVKIGLGTTMTADDILNGMMVISVMVAIVHPAEFIVFTFRQQQQQS